MRFMNSDCKLFVAIVDANPMIEIYCSDINCLIREVREETGRRLHVKPGIDYHEHAYLTDYYGDPRVVSRINRKKFIVYF